MRASEFLDADDSPAPKGSASAFLDDDGGEQPLPAGVRPSSAGAGRGSVNPTPAAKLPPPQAPRGALAAAAGPATSLDPMGSTLTEVPPPPQTLGESLMRPPGQPVPLSDQELADAATGETPAGRAQLEQRRLAGLADASRRNAPSALPDPEADRRAEQAAVKAAQPKGALGAAFEVADTGLDAGRGLVKVAPGIAKTAWDVLRMGADAAGMERFAEFAGASSKAAEQTLQALDNPNGDKNMTGAVQSLGTALFGAGVGGTTGAIVLGSVQSGGDKYSEARNMGFGVGDATEAAVVFGIAEAVGEKLSIPSLGRMVWQNSIARGLNPTEALKEAVKQQGGEQGTQALQSLYDRFGTAGANPNMTFDDYLKDVVDVAKQTAIMSGIAHGAGKVTGAMQRQAFDAALAERARQRAELGALAPGLADQAARNTFDAGQVAPRTVVQLRDMPTTPLSPEQVLAIPRAPAPVEHSGKKWAETGPDTGRQPESGLPTESPPNVSRADLGVAGVPQGALAAIAAGRVKGAPDGRLADDGMAVEPGAPLADAGGGLDGASVVSPQPAQDRVGVAGGAPRAGAQADSQARARPGGDGALTPPRAIDAGSAAVLRGLELDQHSAKLAPEHRQPFREVYAAAARAKPAFDAEIQNIADEIGGTARLTPLKKPGKAAGKVLADYEGDPTRLKDVLRATIEVKSAAEARQAAASVIERFHVTGKRRNLLRDDVTPEDGYRDAKFNVLIDGHIAEVQINLPDMLTAKEGGGHKLYDEREKIRRETEGRIRTDEEQARYDDLNARMRALYEPAWRGGAGRLPSQVSTSAGSLPVQPATSATRLARTPDRSQSESSGADRPASRASDQADTRLRNSDSEIGAPSLDTNDERMVRGSALSQAVIENGEKPTTLPSVTGTSSTSKKRTDGENSVGKAGESDSRFMAATSAPSVSQPAPKMGTAGPSSEVDAGAHEAATSPRNDLPEPTDAQKEAGNYRKGHVSVQGLDIAVENPKGSTRSGKRPDGSTWSHTMSDHYGYIRRTTGADGEQLDVYVGPNPDAGTVFVIDQVNPRGGFDEHKAMIGFESQAAAIAAYKSNFDRGWKVGPVTPMPMADFKTWARSSDATKPLAGSVADAPVLQNRNRSDAAYVQQVSRIAANPDPDRLSFSRDFATGAPVVLADQVDGMVLGRKETITAATGRKIAVQYAVVDAHKLLPSNTADGTVNQGYADGLPGRARVVAGNGRAAGLQAAYKLGTAKAYREGIAADTALHGVPAEAIAGMKKPVLVRVMQPEDVTANIGDESNQSGVADKSAIERARDDARRLDLESLDFDDAGDLTPNTVRQFVDKMPESEQTALRNPDGSPTRQGQDRIMAAIFWQAYESEELVRLYAQATDPESKVVMSGLAAAAPQMMRLRDAGDLDIRSLVAQAAGAAINAKRRGIKLKDYARQGDMDVAAEAMPILQMLADNVRSAKAVGDTLRAAAQLAYAEATKDAADMFGPVEKASRADVLGEIHDTARPKNLGEQAGTKPADGDAQGRPARTGASADPARAENSQAEGKPDEGLFARRSPKGDALRTQDAAVARVERFVDQLKADWKNAPKVIVIRSMADAPAGVRQADESQQAKGADGEPSAFFYSGSVYIVASQMGTSREVATALFHEALGHYGLRGAFGRSLDSVLTQMAVAREAAVRAKAKEYGLDYSDRTQRMHAAEEVLAELAQTQPSNSWVQKVVAAIRTWLRENVAAFKDLALSDAEIIRNFIEPARDFVKAGRADAVEVEKSTFTPGVKAEIPKAFANGYRALEGRKIDVPVRVADTGNVVTLSVDAADELRELDEREAVIRKLMDCLA